jgi:hypothetical protein
VVFCFCCLSVALVADVAATLRNLLLARVVTRDTTTNSLQSVTPLRYLLSSGLLPRLLQIRHGTTCCIRVCPCSEGSLFSIPST